MKTSLGLATLTAATVILGACGGSPAQAPEPADQAASTAATVTLADSDLGRILVDADGRTLYGFTDDIDGESTCYDTCAKAWPPVAGDVQVGDGVDVSLVHTIDRADGSTQLAIGEWPLYRFSGDAGPGDVNGQGSGDAWFAVNGTGTLVGGQPSDEKPAADEPPNDDAPPAAAPSSLGTPVLTDGDGYTLYVFTNDSAGVSNCNEPCSDTWPPVFADESVSIDPLRLDVITREDGSRQLAIDGQALYRYLGDLAPGDVTGHEVGGVWFAVGADGEVIRPAGLGIGSTDIGDALIDGEGFTLYTFDNDTSGASTCNDPCSTTWRPVPGEARIDTSALDAAQFGAITRDDGSLQLAIDGSPLYRYAGDAFPGDANGVTVGGGVWNGVTADLLAPPTETGGAVVSVADQPAVAGGVELGETDLGPTLVDAAGMTLYGLLNDTADTSTCNDACAGAWPPVPGDVALPDGVDSGLFHVIERSDGSTQLAVGDWPLYRFSGDTAPGDVNGQGSGGVWFVANPEGWLYR